MTVEIKPMGNKCNLQCRYCYEDLHRNAGNEKRPYSLQRIMEQIGRIGQSFVLFGGEPLLVPEKDLEKLWAWGHKKYQKNGIQTNGVLINDNHIKMFKKYDVHVGLSVDGPGELNDARWAGTLKKTRMATAKNLTAIETLTKEGVSVSLIVNLHRVNADRDKLPQLHDWFRYLDNLGVSKSRLHLLQINSDHVRKKYALSTEEYIEAFLSLNNLEKELKNLRFDIFEDMRNMMLGRDDKSTCIWTGCDPYVTQSATGIEGNGQISNCGHSEKDGISVVKCSVMGFERYMALYLVPQQFGGCKDCRFFLMCKGQCPGSAIDSDWRNRTENCEVFKALYHHFEDEMLADGLNPLSVRSERKQIERMLFEAWCIGKNLRISEALSNLEKDGVINSLDIQCSGGR